MAQGILRPTKYGPAAAAQTRGAAMADLSQPLMPDKHSKLPNSLSYCDDSEEEVEDNDDGTVISDKSDPGKPTKTNNVLAKIALSVLVVSGMAASVNAVIAVQSAIVLLMGGICFINFLIVAYKHNQIAQKPGIQAMMNAIKIDMDFLRTEIDFLAMSLDDLQSEADMLVVLEKELNDVAKKQNSTVAQIVNLVNENEKHLREMKAYLRETFVIVMADLVIKSGTDEDMKIDLKELPHLSLRLQSRLVPCGIRLDTAKFGAMIREDNDISTVLKFCRKVLSEQDENDDEDNVSVESNGSVESLDFEEFCRTLDEEEDAKMTYDEKLDMVRISEKYSMGSVDVARGKRMTFAPSKNIKESRRESIVNEVKRRQKTLVIKRASLISTTQSSGGHSSRMFAKEKGRRNLEV